MKKTARSTESRVLFYFSNVSFNQGTLKGFIQLCVIMRNNSLFSRYLQLGFAACLALVSLAACAQPLPGDVDDNGEVNISDAIALINYLSTSIEGATPSFPHQLPDSTLKVLSLGNSYSYFATMYVSDLAQSAGIPSSAYHLRMLHPQGYSLQQWAQAIAGNTPIHLITYIGSAPVHGKTGTTVREQLSNDWDIIVLQQNSNNAGDYSTHEPYLSQIIDSIHAYCTNPDVKIAWHMIWSKPGKNWNDIMTATRQVASHPDIDFVIPVGTAIENARNTSVWAGIEGNLMCDNSGHLAPGVAQYIASSSWYYALLTPFFDTALIGNTALRTPEQVDNEWSALPNKQYPDSKIPVTEANNLLCQRCAVAASNDMWKISPDLDQMININVINADVNQDRHINISDLIQLINSLID